jgi:hypothetical protein
MKLSVAELQALASAINETFEAVEDWELPIRTGFSRAEYRALYERIKEELQKLACGEG